MGAVRVRSGVGCIEMTVPEWGVTMGFELKMAKTDHLGRGI
jgi:hypothetical protein